MCQAWLWHQSCEQEIHGPRPLETKNTLHRYSRNITRNAGPGMRGSLELWTEVTQPHSGRPPVPPDNTALEEVDGQGLARCGRRPRGSGVQEAESWAEGRSLEEPPLLLQGAGGRDGEKGTWQAPAAQGTAAPGFSPPVCVKCVKLAES